VTTLKAQLRQCLHSLRCEHAMNEPQASDSKALNLWR